jgi:hypothetical protein
MTISAAVMMWFEIQARGVPDSVLLWVIPVFFEHPEIKQL